MARRVAFMERASYNDACPLTSSRPGQGRGQGKGDGQCS